MKKRKKKEFLKLAEKYRGTATPECTHYGDCGGCMFQDIDYDNQLLLKIEYLNTLFDGMHCFKKINPSSPYRYRNRMDFVTAFGKVGLRRGGNYRAVVDIESCAIQQKTADNILKKVRKRICEVDDYDYLSHKGYLRYIVIRQARFTGQVMLNFLIAENKKLLGGIIDSMHDDVDSISILLNPGIADLSFGEVIENVKGGSIDESLNEVRFNITPNSFFQSNSEIALQMYNRIREEVEGRVLDLYSGVGGISLFVSDICKSVTGVESVSEAVDIANNNREINGIKNVQFVCKDASVYLREISEIGEKVDTLILDPPRAGMHPRMIDYFKKISPVKIVYMSCNPLSLRRDLQELSDYKIKSFEAFDMFPQTPHVETLTVLMK